MSSLKKLPRLGKGIEALIPRKVLSNGRTLINLPLNQIDVNPRQPRICFTEEALNQLVHSIKRIGVAQPVIVRRIERRYELVAGERRYRASKQAGLEAIPAIVRDMTDEQALELALIENLDREDLSAIEVAKGYKRLIDEFAYTHQKMAELFKRSRSAVTNTLRLLGLPDVIQLAVMNGKISEAHARVLLGCDDEKAMMALYDRLIQEGVSVRELEQDVNDLKSNDQKGDKKELENVQPSLFPEWEEKLSYSFGAPVKIKGSKMKGKIVIRYQTEDELAQILAAVKTKK